MNRFALKVLIQVMLIVVTAFLLAWSIQQDYLVVTVFTFGTLLCLQAAGLIWFVQKTNRDLEKFVLAVKYRDSIQKFQKHDGDKSYRNLYQAFNDVIDTIAETTGEREGEHLYFQNTVEHIGVGLISFDENGSVELVNHAAKKLLLVDHIRNISSLDSLHDNFATTLKELGAGKQKLMKLIINSELVTLLIKASVFTIHNKKVKLVSLQNIKPELDEEELDAWQKLIRVLTHEIMNSVSPIKSLTSTIIRMFEKDGQAITPEVVNSSKIDNALTGLHAIEKRNLGLIKFVESYRSLTRVPAPQFDMVKISELFDNVKVLMEEECRANSISFSSDIVPENLEIVADEKLVSQVLINLVSNSIQALSGCESGEIYLTADTNDEGAVFIRTCDNGIGISPEIIDKVFMPFFTTKEQGSGIGLSLSRQIVHKHGGSMWVRSNPSVETCFITKF